MQWVTERFSRLAYAGCKRALLLALLFSAALLLSGGKAFSGQATLSWNAPTKNTDGSALTDLDGYLIYYGTASRSYSQVIDVGNVRSYTVTNLAGGHTYYFAVTAYDTTFNESVFSNEFSKTLPLLPILTINRVGAGRVTGSGIDCGTICSAEYNPGTAVTLNATPDQGSVFSGWAGGGCAGTAACATTINANATVTATFAVLPPAAAFSGSPVSGYAPLIVGFADSSANNPTSWSWTFGDGYSSSEQDPIHVYKTAGTFAVSLTAMNAGGTGSATKTNYITVSSCPVQPVRLARATPVYYSTLQAAYNAASNGDTIQVQALDFIENLTLNRGIDVTFDGGYDCLYTLNPASTTLKGTISMGGGTIGIRHIGMQMR